MSIRLHCCQNVTPKPPKKHPLPFFLKHNVLNAVVRQWQKEVYHWIVSPAVHFPSSQQLQFLFCSFFIFIINKGRCKLYWHLKLFCFGLVDAKILKGTKKKINKKSSENNKKKTVSGWRGGGSGIYFTTDGVTSYEVCAITSAMSIKISWCGNDYAITSRLET